MLVNLNQYRATVRIFNNSFIICENSCTNLFDRKSYSNFTFIFFWVFFIAVIHFIVFLLYIVSLFPEFFQASCKHVFIYLRLALYIFMTVLYLRHIWLYSILIKLSGDVEENPGPKRKPCQSFSICHWNVNSVSAYNFSKVSLLRAYIFIHEFDVICISETFLNFDTAFDDDNLKIEGYNIVRSDHPSNSRRGGVCMYYNHSLALKILDIKYLQECVFSRH